MVRSLGIYDNRGVRNEGKSKCIHTYAKVLSMCAARLLPLGYAEFLAIPGNSRARGSRARRYAGARSTSDRIATRASR